ncbi:unnamed protein product [Nezara viridula]|uniref:Uncharacterized protein n=1 Tax=Nezara viridula TaxID=85310 RepID=A0A9P0E5K6_NEZVI|nr:unnamed protein product [Nezara viridula]
MKSQARRLDESYELKRDTVEWPRHLPSRTRLRIFALVSALPPRPYLGATRRVIGEPPDVLPVGYHPETCEVWSDAEQQLAVPLLHCAVEAAVRAGLRGGRRGAAGEQRRLLPPAALPGAAPAPPPLPPPPGPVPPPPPLPPPAAGGPRALQFDGKIWYGRRSEVPEPVDYSVHHEQAEPSPRSSPASIVDLDSGGGTVLLSSTQSLGRSRLLVTKAATTLDPAEMMEQWNPSPPWSDTTVQKVPDILHQDLSPYVTTTPPTPGSGVSFQQPTTFTFDWTPEQYVPPPPLLDPEEHTLLGCFSWTTGPSDHRLFPLQPPPPPRPSLIVRVDQESEHLLLHTIKGHFLINMEYFLNDPHRRVALSLRRSLAVSFLRPSPLTAS